jgi:acyl carrier protein
MTPADELRATVRACLEEIAPGAGAETMPGDADVRAALDLDSMDVFDLVAALAERTGVDIPDDELPALTTVDALATRLGAGAG